MKLLPRKLFVSSETNKARRGRPRLVPERSLASINEEKRKLKAELKLEARIEVEQERLAKKSEQRELVREVARVAYVERIPILAAIIDAEESSNRDKISAMSELAKVSGLYQMDITSDGKKLETSAIMVKFVQQPILSDTEDVIEGEFVDVNN
jgi:hypothetical protein